nr:MAG TPA: hypothetical protein [Caudoviricetes sp.]
MRFQDGDSTDALRGHEASRRVQEMRQKKGDGDAD